MLLKIIFDEVKYCSLSLSLSLSLYLNLLLSPPSHSLYLSLYLPLSVSLSINLSLPPFLSSPSLPLLSLPFHFSLSQYIYEVHTISFQTFFVWALLLIVPTWNSSPIRSNLLQLQYTCCTVLTTYGRPHRSPLVWPCQWPSSQPLSSPQLSHKRQPLSLGNNQKSQGARSGL